MIRHPARAARLSVPLAVISSETKKSIMARTSEYERAEREDVMTSTSTCTSTRSSIRRAHGPSVWTGAGLQNSDEWIHRLGAAQIGALAAALKHAKGLGLPLEDITVDDFPLHDLRDDLARPM